MKYLELKEGLKETPVFSILDVLKLDPEFNRFQLSRWKEKGYIRGISRGWYIFSDAEVNELLLMLIANKLITPSYISMEYAFSLYNLIPEGVHQITSTTSKKTQILNSPLTTFSYRHIKANIFFGYHLQKTQHGNIIIADLEKALLDFIYLTPQANHADYFYEMRLDKDILKETLDHQKFNLYLKTFDQKNLTKRAKELLYYVTH